MPRIDLNIVDRGAQGTSWTADSIALTAESLDEVMEQKTDNSGALNSLPTPFARFFVAKEAFRRLLAENLNSSNEAGFAYSQMVSDILDVYELLFNQTFHKNNSWKRGERLELREWKSQENLAIIKAKMPVFYNSIEEYFNTDIKEDKLFFLVFSENGKEVLLACSSPFTGFVTPPDMDKSMAKTDGVATLVFAGEQYKDLHIRRKSGGEYFRDVKSFSDREADFKNYMFNTLFGSDDVDGRYKEIKEFVRSYKLDSDIRSDYKQKLAPVKTDQNDDLVINGLRIQELNEIDVNNFFTDTLIRLPYRISKDNFISVTYQNDFSGRDYDYLLPFKPEVMSLFDDGHLDADIHINRNSVTAILRYNNKEYTKEYALDPFQAGQGRIVDLQGCKISFDLGIFPNILSQKVQENNYFKVLVVGADEDPEAPNFNIDQISLSFFKNGEDGFEHIKEVTAEQNASFGTWPAVVRSRQKTELEESGTKFYELYNTTFDLIEVKVLNYTGLIMPIWRRSQATNDTYTFIEGAKLLVSRSKILF